MATSSVQRFACPQSGRSWVHAGLIYQTDGLFECSTCGAQGLRIIGACVEPHDRPATMQDYPCRACGTRTTLNYAGICSPCVTAAQSFGE